MILKINTYDFLEDSYAPQNQTSFSIQSLYILPSAQEFAQLCWEVSDIDGLQAIQVWK